MAITSKVALVPGAALITMSTGLMTTVVGHRAVMITRVAAITDLLLTATIRAIDLPGKVARLITGEATTIPDRMIIAPGRKATSLTINKILAGAGTGTRATKVITALDAMKTTMITIVGTIGITGTGIGMNTMTNG